MITGGMTRLRSVPWMLGAPGCIASSGSKTAGSTSYSTAISSSASSATSSLTAATAATPSPKKRTLSARMYWSRTSEPARGSGWPACSTCGTSSDVRMAFTPGSRAARLVSMLTIRAWACGLRLILACSMPGRRMSPVYLAAPVAFSMPSTLGSRLPTMVVGSDMPLSYACATDSTASTIFAYPVHRHRLPAMASRTSSSVGLGFSSSSAFAASTMPGVQKPH